MEEISIKEFFQYLRGYIFAFIAALILFVGGIVAYDIVFKDPVYQAQTEVVIAQLNSDININDVNVSQKLVTNYSEIAKSELVINQVINNLNLPVSAKELSKNLTIKPVDNSSILNISVRDANAKLSAVIANEIVKVFTEEVKTIYGSDNVTQLSVAATPSAPANNTTIRDIVLAAVIAIVLVTGLAFIRFYLDDTVKDNDDVEKNIGLPVAGRITKGDVSARRGSNELIVEKTPKAIVSENIKSLRTNLQFTAVDRTLKTVLVTSTNASEGKSFVSANLAISFAQADKRVLLVDCDLRKGRVHKLFSVPNTKGLSDLLADDLRSFAEYIRPTKTRNLDLITCGTYPPNPSELLASKKNRQLIKVLRDYYDIVIFDGAPVGGLADSVILSSLVDGTLIVVRESGTSKSDLIAAKDSLRKVGGKILGLVINMTNNRSSKYYNSYYYGESK